MNDAIALLAISQLVCLGALFYLYTQLQEVRKGVARKRQPSARVHQMGGARTVNQYSTARAAKAAYAPPSEDGPVSRGDLAALVARANGAIDVAALARRMRKSEEEVRLLLRRQGIAG